MNPLLRSYHLWRHLGSGWMLFRLKLAVQARLRWNERHFPIQDWNQRPLRNVTPDASLAEPEAYLRYRRERAPQFFFHFKQRAEYARHLAEFDSVPPSALATANGITRGEFPYFESQTVRLAVPPNWRRNPFTGQETPLGVHWSRIGDFGTGDIKLIWELSRFSFVYPLVRAWWRTEDPSYSETFWRLVEDWRDQNPPNVGANWKCGQEASLRVMAWCFGLYGFMGAPESTPQRVTALAEMIAFSGERISGHIDYALSQNNNHGISEAMGLWTIGLLFPEFRRAAEWRETGRSLLEDQGRKLIYDDGAFSQHSANYQRLMLHDYLWALRLGEIHQAPLSDELIARIRRAGQFLYQLQDDATGNLPRYGNNDGSLILPLNNCRPDDYRPVIQAIQYLTDGTNAYGPGSWNEDLLWLFGAAALKGPVNPGRRSDFSAPDGGVWTLRSEKGFATVRSPRFKHRPAQADSLHIDLWWNGINVALDPGTFSYNAPAPWDNSLARTRFHNTVTVDDQDQMPLAGRFLFLPWLRGTGAIRDFEVRGAPPKSLRIWEGSHDGYRRLSPPVDHHRAILRCPGETWLIIDRLASAAFHSYRLHWLLPNVPYESDGAGNLGLCLNGSSAPNYHIQAGCDHSAQSTILVADSVTSRGWFAPQYFLKEKALSMDLTTNSPTAWFWTLFSPDFSKLAFSENSVSIDTGQWSLAVDLHTEPGQMISARSLQVHR